MAGPYRPGCQYKVHLLDGQGLGAEHPGCIGYVSDAESDDDVVQGRSQGSHYGNRQNQGREGHHGIDYSLNDEVGLAAEMDARNAHHHAYAGPDKRAEQPGVQGNPCAVDESAEHVTAQLVAAQQQLRSGGCIDESRVRLGGVVRGNKRGKDGDDHQDQGDYGPKGAQRLSPGKAPQMLPDGASWRPAPHRHAWGDRYATALLSHSLSFVLRTGRLTVTDSGVQPAVDHIQKQVQNKHRDGYHHDDGLNFRVVPVEYAINEELAHPRHHEDVLDHHGARQKAAKLERRNGDHG